MEIAPTSFCKCTCFTNSTIIPLDAPASPPLQNRNAFEGFSTARSPADEDSKSDSDGKGQDRKEYRAGNCNDCNRQFCLDYNLPICKKASMEDVFTTCFRKSERNLMAVTSELELRRYVQREIRERMKQLSSSSSLQPLVYLGGLAPNPGWANGWM